MTQGDGANILTSSYIQFWPTDLSNSYLSVLKLKKFFRTSGTATIEAAIVRCPTCGAVLTSDVCRVTGVKWLLAKSACVERCTDTGDVEKSVDTGRAVQTEAGVRGHAFIDLARAVSTGPTRSAEAPVDRVRVRMEHENEGKDNNYTAIIAFNLQ